MLLTHNILILGQVRLLRKGIIGMAHDNLTFWVFCSIFSFLLNCKIWRCSQLSLSEGLVSVAVFKRQKWLYFMHTYVQCVCVSFSWLRWLNPPFCSVSSPLHLHPHNRISAIRDWLLGHFSYTLQRQEANTHSDKGVTFRSRAEIKPIVGLNH